MHLPLDCVDAATCFSSGSRASPTPNGSARSSGRRSSRCSKPRAGAGRVRLPGAGDFCPDVIESVSIVGPSAAIKSHHNVGGCRPRCDSRSSSRCASCSRTRCACSAATSGSTRSSSSASRFRARSRGPHHRRHHPRAARLLRLADAIVASEIRAAGLSAVAVAKLRRACRSRAWVSWATNARTSTIAVRAVEPRRHDRRLGPAPHDVLGRISSRIVNEVKGINRVVYSISSKPPSTIEWE